jgi:hypothetical protein
MSAQPTVELYDPYFHTPRDERYEVYARLRDEHPVFHAAAHDVWCISRYADVQAFSRDWKRISNEPGVDLEAPNFMGPGDFLDSDPPEHDRLRAATRPFFAPKPFARLTDAIHSRADDLCAGLLEHEEIDLAGEFTWKLPTWVIMRMLGVPSSDDDLVHGLVSVTMERDPGELQMPERASEALQKLQEYIGSLAEEKARSPEDDVMSALVQGDDGPSREELVGMTTLLFIAGSLTTVNFLSNTLALLEGRPDLWKYIAGEDDKLRDMVIEESLRLEAPVQYLARTATTDVELHDEVIPEGARVILIYGAANRDDRRWPDAETLDPHREEKRHLTFGEGIHFCMGAPLARLEGRILLPAFARTVSEYEIVERERIPSHHDLGWKRLRARIRPTAA